MTFGTRLKQARREAGLTQAELAAICGWESQSRISMYERGEREPNQADLRRLARATGKPIAWFLHEPAASVDDRIIRLEIPVVRVPILGDTNSSPDIDVFALPSQSLADCDYLDTPAMDENAYALRVVGDSLAPRMQAGEYLVIYPGQKPAPGDQVVVRTTTGATLIKRFERYRNGDVYLTAIADHRRIVLPITDVEYMHHIHSICCAGPIAAPSRE